MIAANHFKHRSLNEPLSNKLPLLSCRMEIIGELGMEQENIEDINDIVIED